HAGGRTGHQRRPAANQAPEIERMEAIDILGGIDRFKHAFGVDVGRERQLHEDAVDFVALVEVGDDFEQSAGGSCFGGLELPASEDQFFAGGDFTFDVHAGSGIVAYQPGGQAGANAGGTQRGNFVLQFGVNLVADSVSVEDGGRQL